MRPDVVWTVAGFDPSSGAGVTADLMVFAAHGLFGCTAITALTVQSTRGVRASEPVRPELLAATLEMLGEDLPPKGIKVGMLGTPEHCRTLARFLARGVRCPVVLDPVLRSSSGRELYPAAALEVLHEELLPRVRCITPNWDELAALSGSAVTDAGSAEYAALQLIARHPGLDVLVTGGDQKVPTDLLRTSAGERLLLEAEHVETRSTHGTGCAFSSALLASLVQGQPIAEAAVAAKRYVYRALQQAPGLGAGKGPLGLLWPLQ